MERRGEVCVMACVGESPIGGGGKRELLGERGDGWEAKQCIPGGVFANLDDVKLLVDRGQGGVVVSVAHLRTTDKVVYKSTMTHPSSFAPFSSFSFPSIF